MKNNKISIKSLLKGFQFPPFEKKEKKYEIFIKFQFEVNQFKFNENYKFNDKRTLTKH